jgi:hypothetical protein
VFEYVGQTFQLRHRIYSEKWTLLKPLMWNPFISSQKTYIRTDFARDEIHVNNLKVLKVYCAPILVSALLLLHNYCISRIFMEISDLLWEILFVSVMLTESNKVF